jgi:hypothetical protein
MEFEQEILEELYNIAQEDDDCEFKLDRILELLEEYFQKSSVDELDYE